MGKFLGYGVVLLLIIALFSWILKNIIGVIGFGLIIFGIYKTIDNREKGYFSKYPILCIPFGIVISFGWFVFQEILDALGFIFFFSTIILIIAAIILVIKKNPQWKIFIVSSIATFSISVAVINNIDPEIDKNYSQQLILAANHQNNPSNQNQQATRKIPAKVTRVIDGDTMEVTITENGKTKKETVRLLLVDTPETKDPNKPVQPFGPEASQFTKETLEGKNVELELDTSERDKYGRLLCYLWIGNKMFNESLLEKGLARVAYIYPPNVKYVDQFNEIQKKAQEAGLGIWSIENYVQEDGFHEEFVANKENVKQTEEAKQDTNSTKTEPQKQEPQIIEPPKQNQTTVYYASCAQVRAAGKAPLRKGDPGYSLKLDRDKDGIACE